MFKGLSNLNINYFITVNECNVTRNRRHKITGRVFTTNEVKVNSKSMILTYGMAYPKTL